MQKYEGGTNSLAASRLWQMARVLDVPVGFFFDAMPAAVDALAESDGASVPVPPLDRRETLDLLGCFYRVRDPALRRRVFDLVTMMVGVLEEVERQDAARHPPTLALP